MGAVTKALIALVVTLAIALAGTLAYTQRTVKKLAISEQATKTAQAELKRTNATLTLRNAQKAASDRKAASASKALETALEAHAAWGSTNTPTEVKDALCAVLDCGTGAPHGVR